MSFPRYPRYKDSGFEWLGDMPEHWEIPTLKRKMRLITEKSERRINPVALENIEGWTGRFIATASEFEGEGVAFEAGDILFGKLRPYLAKVYLSQNAGEAVGDFHVLRPYHGVEGRYAQYHLLSRDFISMVDGSTFGAKMPRASWEFLGSMPLPVPPACEQKSIVSFLDRETAKIDALTAEQERLIALLKEKRQAVISHAVTKGLNPDVPMKDSGVEWLGYIPAHWEVRALKHVAQKITDGEHISPKTSEEGFPLLSAKDVRDWQIDYDVDKFVSPEDADRFWKRCRPKQGDVLIVSRGATVGRVAVVEKDIPFCLMGSVILCSPQSGQDAEFFYFALNAKHCQTLLWFSSASSAQQAIYIRDVAEVPVAIPPHQDRQAIAEFLKAETTKLDSLTSECQRAIDLLQERRTALISAAVTGQIDVRNHAAAA